MRVNRTITKSSGRNGRQRFLFRCLVLLAVFCSVLTQLDNEMIAIMTETAYGSQKKSGIPTCFVNLHIPKVGGRTVGSFLKQVLLQSPLNFKLYRQYGSEDLLWHTTHKAYIQGHFTTRIFVEYPELQDCFTMTVLREPVDRAVSAFFFHRHRIEQIDYCLSKDDANLLLCRNYWQYSNDMTLRLAGPPDIPWQSSALGKSAVVANETKPNNETPQQLKQRIRRSKIIKRRDRYATSKVVTTNETHLVDAKTNLMQYFDLVCFLSDLPSCAEQVLATFRMDPADMDVSMMTLNKDNVHKTRTRPKRLPSDAFLKFQGANQLDLELYNWALSNFS
eukprot:scaffold3254_cov98-Cylindrotheca_fusiformis.AAC.7